MKFKIGDKVKIKHISYIPDDCTRLCDDFVKMVGKESVIIEVDDSNTLYHVRCLTNPDDFWWFDEDELELVEDNSTETKRFKHFKGGVYKLLHHGFDSKDLSKVVIYQSEETGDIFVRPHDEFFGTVTKQRFELIEGE